MRTEGVGPNKVSSSLKGHPPPAIKRYHSIHEFPIFLLYCLAALPSRHSNPSLAHCQSEHICAFHCQNHCRRAALRTASSRRETSCQKQHCASTTTHCSWNAEVMPWTSSSVGCLCFQPARQSFLRPRYLQGEPPRRGIETRPPSPRKLCSGATHARRLQCGCSCLLAL